MSEIITNQLTFRTNSEQILILLKSGAAGQASPPHFSLNSIKPMPQALSMLHAEYLAPLLMLNIEIPPLEEKIRHNALTRMFAQAPRKADEATIRSEIEAFGAHILADSEKNCREIFEQGVDNYNRYSFFNQIDWRMAHWGTIEDIRSVVESTFEPPTGLIEFTTFWTPPLAALQELADMFPSVRFELKYRSEPENAWTDYEIFPVKPWGY